MKGDAPSGPFGSEVAAETRTSASARPSCRQCGGPIAGRRRNGYCTDRCRMRGRRAARSARVRQQLASIELALSDLSRLVKCD
jgi:hypothetical protein